MNYIDSKHLQEANDEAIFNIYLYLVDKTTPSEHELFQSIIVGLEAELRAKKPNTWKDRDIYRLNILKNAVKANPLLAYSRISNLTVSKNGLTACSFIKPNGNISVVFKGTGDGEWIDNGEGLSGIPEENTYITYSQNGDILYSETVTNDYASDQQVEALNWFNLIKAKNGWDSLRNIAVSGHSKGGNKAQFVAMHSDNISVCYSFDGQGFSPEALTSLKNRYGIKYSRRRQRIHSFATDNDYVNVLGERLVPENHIYYFKSSAGIHYMESMLNIKGGFNPQSEQARLSVYVETFSQELMSMNPRIRQYATLGIMNIFQKYLGDGIPVNNDKVSIEKTIAGIIISISTFLRRIHEIQNEDI